MCVILEKLTTGLPFLLDFSRFICSGITVTSVSKLIARKSNRTQTTLSKKWPWSGHTSSGQWMVVWLFAMPMLGFRVLDVLGTKAAGLRAIADTTPANIGAHPNQSYKLSISRVFGNYILFWILHRQKQRQVLRFPGQAIAPHVPTNLLTRGGNAR